MSGGEQTAFRTPRPVHAAICATVATFHCRGVSLGVHVGCGASGDGPLAMKASAMATIVHGVEVCCVGGRCFVGVGSGQEKVRDKGNVLFG